MLWRQKILRITAALGVAAAAAHTAERLKAPADEQPLLVSAAKLASSAEAATPTEDPVPQSASLSTPGVGMGDLVGITSVAAVAPPAGSDRCHPALALDALPGAMIHLSLSAPCNRGERIVVRHSGLSFAAQTQADGTLGLTLPALKSDAMVAVYLQDAKLVMGRVTVPDASAYVRFGVVWEPPAEVELRVTDGDKVLVGTASPSSVDERKVFALGVASVTAPVLARVYSVPGTSLGEADVTGELRITPASCGRTLRVETVYSAQGSVDAAERSISVPLCGTSGDILLLKNLAPTPKLAAPK